MARWRSRVSGDSESSDSWNDPLAWATRYGVAPEKAGEGFLDLLLQGDGGAKARDAVLGAGRDGKPDALRKALQLILHCPEYQLA